MRILWISNIQFPAISEFLGMPIHVGGGWMYSLALELLQSGEIDLAVGTVYNGTVLTIKDIDGITYYLIPKNKSRSVYDKNLEPFHLPTNPFYELDSEV